MIPWLWLRTFRRALLGSPSWAVMTGRMAQMEWEKTHGQ